MSIVANIQHIVLYRFFQMLPDIPVRYTSRSKILCYGSHAIYLCKEFDPRLQLRLQSELEIVVPQDIIATFVSQSGIARFAFDQADAIHKADNAILVEGRRSSYQRKTEALFPA